VLETEDLGLSINSLIEIKFDVNDSHQLHNVILPAIVKRIEKGKIALAFEMLEKATEQIIRQQIVERLDINNKN